MRTVATIALAAMFASLATSSTPAQEKCSGCSAAHRHGPPALLLLSRKAIRDDLKLTNEQTAKVRAALVTQITAFVEAADLGREAREQKIQELRRQGASAVAAILTPEQLGRLKQIRVQVEGPRALLNPRVAGELKITDEQRAKLTATFQAARKEFAAVFANNTNREQAGAKVAELRKRIGEEVASVLTEEQRSRWQELRGAPIQGEVHFWHGHGWRHQGGARE